MNKAYVYTVKRDYGFAPNPFHGILTLATCKPGIRKGAQIGDYVIGHSDVRSGNKLIYMMKVTQVMTYDEYWNAEQFMCKRPVMNGSLVKLYGDNIYHLIQDGIWVQEDSHHSLEDGTENAQNKNRDTKANRVLISDDFFYLGRSMCAYPVGTDSLKYPYVGQKVFINDEVDIMWNYLSSTYPEKGLIDDPMWFRNFQRYDGHS